MKMGRIVFKNGNKMLFDESHKSTHPLRGVTPPFQILLERNPMINIPTDSEELAELLWNNSYDWAVVLDFFQKLADKRGIIIKSWEVAEIIKEKYINGK